MEKGAFDPKRTKSFPNFFKSFWEAAKKFFY